MLLLLVLVVVVVVVVVVVLLLLLLLLPLLPLLTLPLLTSALQAIRVLTCRLDGVDFAVLKNETPLLSFLSRFLQAAAARQESSPGGENAAPYAAPNAAPGAAPGAAPAARADSPPPLDALAASRSLPPPPPPKPPFDGCDNSSVHSRFHEHPLVHDDGSPPQPRCVLIP